MDRVQINGKEVLAEGIDAFSPEYGLDENSRTYTYGIGSQLVVSGDDAKELIDTFFSDCKGNQRSLPIRIYKDCCDQWFDYTIQYEGTTYCPTDCSVEFTPVRVTETTRCFNYLNDTIFWKNGFIDAFDHPQIWYCNQPGFVQKVLFIFAPFILFQLAVINSIITVIETLCEVVTIGFGECNIERPDFLDGCFLMNALLGCGKKSPAPLIREILEYHTAQCGLTLKSSIFQQSQYKNMVLFQQQYERGRFSAVNWINGNGAKPTVIDILESLSFMNIDYRIIGNQLFVERKDYFDNLRTNVGSLQGLDYCITFRDDNACAYGRYAYADDALDTAGNETINWTDDIIEFNAENADWKRGECTVAAPYGRARFMFDEITGNDESNFFSDYAIDSIRSGNYNASSINPIARILATYVANNCDNTVRRSRDLILSGDQASQLKLLILEDDFDRSDAKVIRKQITGFPLAKPGAFYWYNYPMSFRQFEPDGNTEFTGGIYSNFQEIDNPNNTNRVLYEISNLEVPYDCNTVADIDSTQVGLVFDAPTGKAYPETATIDFERGVIVYSNIEVRCE